MRMLMRRLPALGRVMVLLPVLASPAASAASADDLLDLAAFRGQVVYVDFWASWSAPCRRSFPWMSRMQGELGPDGFIVIGVNLDHVHADAEQFLEDHRFEFVPQLERRDCGFHVGIHASSAVSNRPC